MVVISDSNTRMAVIGFNRKIANELLQNCAYQIFQNVPFSVHMLCIAYYAPHERFASTNCGSCVISDDGKTVSKIINSGSYDQTTYGEFEIVSTQPGKYEWKLSIALGPGSGTNPPVNSRISVGISSDNDPNKDFAVSEASHSFYAYNGFNGYVLASETMNTYGKMFGHDDTIGICLNIKQTGGAAEISFSKNDEKPKIAFSNVTTEDSVRYRLSVSLADLGDVVRLKSLKISNYNRRLSQISSECIFG